MLTSPECAVRSWDADGVTRLSFDALSALLGDVLIGAGVSPDSAAILGRNCAMCERDGALSHGIFRIPGYRASLASGWVDGRAVPIVETVGPAFLRVDAANGFAQPALAAARSRLVAIARDTGIALLAIRHSHHFGALWPDIEGFAAEGLIALTTVAGHACVAPFGATSPLFGTNPIAFAAPVADGAPLVFDQATSAISHGDLRIAAREGRSIAPGVGIDSAGRPALDPDAVLDGGALLPFGEHKGATLSLMVEILASALTGGAFSHEVDHSDHPGAETPRTGQLVIVIDPDRGAATGATAARTAQLIALLHAAGVDRLPGEQRHARRREAERDGIAIDADRLHELREWAEPPRQIPTSI